MKNTSLITVMAKGFLNLIFAEILCLFINLTLAFSGSALFKIITVICTSVIFIGLICNYAYNTAKSDLATERQTKSKFSGSRCIFIGIFLSMPYVLLWGILFISKAEIIGNFYNAYKLINGQFLQLYNLICNSTEISAVSMTHMIIMLSLTIIPAVSFIISYKLTYNGVDVDKIQYK